MLSGAVIHSQPLFRGIVCYEVFTDLVVACKCSHSRKGLTENGRLPLSLQVTLGASGRTPWLTQSNQEFPRFFFTFTSQY